MRALGVCIALAVGASGCSGGGSASSAASATSAPGGLPGMDSHLQLAAGFSGSVVARVDGARELTVLPNGDLLAGTNSETVYIVPNADASGAPGQPAPFITLSEGATNGVAFAPGFVFVGTEHHVWRIPYRTGDRSEPSSGAVSIALLRQGSPPPSSDGDVHTTTSLAVGGSTLYAGVGSSCNACTEIDPTRATIQKMGLDGSGMTTLARRFRNPIALAINQATGTLWAGGAGQDDLPYGHPFEFFDPVTLHAPVVDYGWPQCEENHNPFGSGTDCSNTVAPRVEFTSYATEIGAAFYPASQTGTYAFGQTYRGAFVAWHGSWHCCPSTAPRVAYVPINGDEPATAVNWNDPTTQWQTLLHDDRDSPSSRSYPVRFTGVAVGTQGSLFIADDATGSIYRIRPSGAAASAVPRRVRGAERS